MKGYLILMLIGINTSIALTQSLQPIRKGYDLAGQKYITKEEVNQLFKDYPEALEQEKIKSRAFKNATGVGIASGVFNIGSIFLLTRDRNEDTNRSSEEPGIAMLAVGGWVLVNAAMLSTMISYQKKGRKAKLRAADIYNYGEDFSIDTKEVYLKLGASQNGLGVVLPF